MRKPILLWVVMILGLFFSSCLGTPDITGLLTDANGAADCYYNNHTYIYVEKAQY